MSHLPKEGGLIGKEGLLEKRNFKQSVDRRIVTPGNIRYLDIHPRRIIGRCWGFKAFKMSIFEISIAKGRGITD